MCESRVPSYRAQFRPNAARQCWFETEGACNLVYNSIWFAWLRVVWNLVSELQMFVIVGTRALSCVRFSAFGSPRVATPTVVNSIALLLLRPTRLASAVGRDWRFVRYALLPGDLEG